VNFRSEKPPVRPISAGRGRFCYMKLKRRKARIASGNPGLAL
jgi:hypothetical protein